MNMTEKEVSEKYANIEDKIPSVWETYKQASVELLNDLSFIWNVRDPELYRVIVLVQGRVNRTSEEKIDLYQHLDHNFSFLGLYPDIHRLYKVNPDTK